MNLTTGFNKFIEKINFDQNRKDNLISAHNTLREYLEKDDEIKEFLIKTKLQGSYATNTAIKPVGYGEYDVDIAVFLNLKDSNGHYIMPGYSVMNWLYNIIIKYSDYKGKAQQKTRSVRIKYSNQLRLDVTPLHYVNDNLSYIPPDWKETNPERLIKWCTVKHSESFQKYYPITKIIKYWRDLQFGYGSHPKSIILLTLAGIYIDKNETRTLNESLLLTMKKINKLLQDNRVVPEITNPTLKSEKISERWDYFNYFTFRNKFKTATEKFEQAFNEADESRTIEILNSDDLFKGNFPKTLFEEEIKKAMSYSSLISEKKLGIKSDGSFTSNDKEKISIIPPYGSYGENV